jgi:amino acid permease
MTSLLAFLFAMFLTFAITYRSVEYGNYCDVRFVPEQWLDVFQTIPVFSFSFVTHLNVLPVYGQLESRTPTLMRTVFRNAIFFALVLYILVGTFGYLRFTCSGGAPDNILAFSGGFDQDDLLVAAARIAEALTCTLALPLIQHPTRTALHSLFFHPVQEDEDGDEAFDEREEDYHNSDSYQSLQQQSDGYFLGSIEEENASDVASHSEAATVSATRDTVTSLLAHEAGEGVTHTTPALRLRCSRRMERIVLAAVIMTTSFSLAIVVPNISTVFGLMGSTCCSLICFVLPGLFYLQSTKRVLVEFPMDRPYSAKDLENLRRVVYQRRLSWVLIVFGALVGVFGTVATVANNM